MVMRCKECIHAYVCYFEEMSTYDESSGDKCPHFEHENKYVGREKIKELYDDLQKRLSGRLKNTHYPTNREDDMNKTILAAKSITKELFKPFLEEVTK